MFNIGMLTVRNEIDVIDEFLDDVAKHFTTVVVMDDSTDGTYDKIASRDFIKYLCKYSDVYDPSGRRTDGQKQHLFQHIIDNYGWGVWITNLNADAFFADDPNTAIESAESEGTTLVKWGCRNFLPHLTDKKKYLNGEAAWLAMPVQQRLKWYLNIMYFENLQFKSVSGQGFDVFTHHRVVPFPDVFIPSEQTPMPLINHYPLRSPDQISARCADRLLTGFRKANYFEPFIESGGWVVPGHRNWNDMVLSEPVKEGT